MSGVGLVPAALQVADLGWRQLLRSKLLIGLGILVALPTIMASIIHAYAKESPAAQDFQIMQVLILSTAVVPLVSLLLGTGAMATERESGTLSFLFTRPTPRAAVLLGKALAAAAFACATTLVATLCVWIASGAPDASVGGGAAALALQALVLTAIFVLMGTVFPRSLYVGLAYVVLVEGVLGTVVSAQGGYTVSYHVRNMLSEWSGDRVDEADILTTMPGSAAASALTLLAVAAVAIAAACWWVETREFGLRDRPKEE